KSSARWSRGDVARRNCFSGCCGEYLRPPSDATDPQRPQTRAHCGGLASHRCVLIVWEQPSFAEGLLRLAWKPVLLVRDDWMLNAGNLMSLGNKQWVLATRRPAILTVLFGRYAI